MADTTNFQKHVNKNPIQKFLINYFYSVMINLIKPLKSEKILDVGAGEGFSLVKLKRNQIGKFHEGVDNSKDALKLGKKMYPKINLKLGSIYELPYKENSFDLLLCTEVLEHLDDPKKAVKELKRVTSKYIVFSTPNEPLFTIANFLRGKYLKTFGNHPEHINHWSSGGLKKFLRQNGLKVVCVKTPFPWTLILAKKGR